MSEEHDKSILFVQDRTENVNQICTVELCGISNELQTQSDCVDYSGSHSNLTETGDVCSVNWYYQETKEGTVSAVFVTLTASLM